MAVFQDLLRLGIYLLFSQHPSGKQLIEAKGPNHGCKVLGNVSNDNTIWPLISHLEFISELESLGWIHCSCTWLPCGLICGSHRKGPVTAELLMSAGVCTTFLPLPFITWKIGIFLLFCHNISVVSGVSNLADFSRCQLNYSSFAAG